MTTFVGRVRRRAALELRRPRASVRRRLAGRRLWDAVAATPSADDDAATPDVSMLMSFRMTSDDRVRILGTLLHLAGGALAGSDVPLVVGDASDPARRREVGALLRETGMLVDHRELALPLADALHAMLGALTTPYFAFQLDDMWPVGLDPDYLRDSVGFLERHRGRVDVVIPPPALRTSLEHESHTIRVVAHERRGRSYRFGFGRWVRPVHVERVGSHTYGVFPNFLYGFFFNDVIAGTDDYARRLRWYLDHVSHDAHAIELAGRAWRGPIWHHIAIPLDGISVVDLDYAHTGIGTRDDDPTARGLVDALASGWPIHAAIEHR